MSPFLDRSLASISTGCLQFPYFGFLHVMVKIDPFASHRLEPGTGQVKSQYLDTESTTRATRTTKKQDGSSKENRQEVEPKNIS